MLLSEAKDQLESKISEGVICPCCNQYAKLYKRKLSSSMTIALIEIFKAHKQIGFDYFHVEDYFKSLPNLPSSIRGDFPKLKHWNLIYGKEENREDSSPRNGYYMISGRGIRFLRNQLSVPSHIFLYNNEVKDVSETLVSVTDCLGAKFNYHEMMGGL
jgi:hypothetical protein